MKRRDARVEAFLLIFEMGFKDYSVDELLELAEESREVTFNDYTKRLIHLVFENLEEIDKTISDNLTNWKMNRIPKTNLALLRLAVAEFRFMPDVPVKVTVNEAVELAKIYSSNEDAAFINGVLGSVLKNNTFTKDDEE